MLASRRSIRFVASLKITQPALANVPALHTNVATSLAQLAEIQKRQPEYPAVLTSLNDMAKMLESQGRYDEAKPIFIEALAVVKRELPGQHMELAHALHNWSDSFAFLEVSLPGTLEWS